MAALATHLGRGPAGRRWDPRSRFLLTGSVPPVDAALHSGAGRIISLRMRPLSLAERRVEQPTVSVEDLLDDRLADIDGDTDLDIPGYVHEIVSSGFPGIRPLAVRLQRAQLDDATSSESSNETFPRQDLRSAGRAAGVDGRIAAATATMTSYEKILRATLGGVDNPPTKVTALGYRDVLASLWMLDPVPAWLPSSRRVHPLGQAPKHHLADPALAARLLGLTADRLLREPVGTFAGEGPVLGRLFESLVTTSLQTYAQRAQARVSHAPGTATTRSISCSSGPTGVSWPLRSSSVPMSTMPT